MRLLKRKTLLRKKPTIIKTIEIVKMKMARRLMRRVFIVIVPYLK